MVPSSVEKMNAEVPVFPPLETWKLPAFPLNTTPVGVPVPVLPEGGGTVTVSGTLAPAPLYSVLTPAPLSEIQNGLVGEWVRPQGLTRFGSIVTAGTAPRNQVGNSDLRRRTEWR